MIESSPQEFPRESFPRKETYHSVASLDKYRKLKRARQEGTLPQKEAVKQTLTAMLNNAVSEQELKERFPTLSVEKAFPLIQALKENTDTISKMTDELEALKRKHTELRSQIIDTLYAINEEDEKEE